jgi:hypothetical protein
MMRPQRIDEGADRELLAGLLGAKVVLDGVGDLLAWITADAAGGAPPGADSRLIDVLLGLAAISAALDRQPLNPSEPQAHDVREPEACKPPVPDGTLATKELLR